MRHLIQSVAMMGPVVHQIIRSAGTMASVINRGFHHPHHELQLGGKGINNISEQITEIRNLNFLLHRINIVILLSLENIKPTKNTFFLLNHF